MGAPRRLPDYQPLRTRILDLIRRWPGVQQGQICRRLRVSSTGPISATLRALVAEGHIERRKVTDPEHDNYGREGYFWMTRNPM